MPRSLPRLELRVSLEDPGPQRLVGGQLELGLVVDAAQGVLVQDLAEDAGRIKVGENLTRLDEVILDFLIQVAHEPHCLIKTLARSKAAQPPDLASEMEGMVSARRGQGITRTHS